MLLGSIANSISTFGEIMVFVGLLSVCVMFFLSPRKYLTRFNETRLRTKT
jgi:hypothetical protein